ncbi:MAG: hypothetical protein K2W95_16820 [Candidatus Obscuribacterales bacterium]|nr:hypothetical protein [Candidatus Obscuribacterales bacterium]
MFSIFELKKLIYIIETALGVIAAAVAVNLFCSAHSSPAPALLIVPAGVLFVVSIGTILFGLVTYLIRDDEDVWR